MDRVSFFPALLGALSAIMLGCSTISGICLEQKKPEAAKPTEAKQSSEGKGVEIKPSSDIQKFCMNNAVALGDAKIAWQTARLVELQAQIKRSIAELESKRAQYSEWLRKRDEAMQKAADTVVAIYAHMRPDAAALQLAALDDVMAAAVLSKLTARTASAILNEMEPGRAAKLTRTMVGPDVEPDEKKS